MTVLLGCTWLHNPPEKRTACTWLHLASQNRRVRLLSQERQPLDGDCGRRPHSSTGVHDKRSECPMLNIDHTSLILPPFLQFIPTIAWGSWGGSMGSRPSLVPEFLCRNIKSTLSSTLVERSWNCSLLRGWSTGSTATHGHISVRRSASRSLILLCLMMGNAPFRQEKAWSMLKGTPQTQWDGRRLRGHPYCRHKASRNACLCRLNPESVIGMAVIHQDAPSSQLCSIAAWWFWGRPTLT